MVKTTHGRKSARILLCYSANVTFSKVITKKCIIKAHLLIFNYKCIMHIRTLYASSIVTKCHQILSMTLLTSNNQTLVINKTTSMVQWDTINLRYLLLDLASSL